MTSSTHNLPDESAPLAHAAQHGDERSAYVGSARTVLVEQQLEAIERLTRQLIQRTEQQSKELAIRRKKHKRDAKHTAEAIRRAKRLSDVEAVIRAGHRGRLVEGIDTKSITFGHDFTPVQAFQDFAAFVPFLPPELLQEIPWTPFVYSMQHMFMTPQIHRGISWHITDHDARNREYQELLHTYLHITADRMADISPSYLDAWRSYIPSMAFGPNGHPALLEALVALAAIHLAPLQKDPDRARKRASLHYHAALHYQRDDDFLYRLDDAVLATALVCAHYELWSGEIVKMGIHMLGAKKIILMRGKEASQTPLGRTLFALFLRTDIQSAVVTGNPVFFDETWWKNDPLYSMPIPHDAPILLAADIALVKLSVVIAKLTFLKRSAAVRRKKLLTKIEAGEIPDDKGPNSPFVRLERHIRQQCSTLKKELQAWHRSLPSWFTSLQLDEVAKGEEDINSTNITEIRPQRYPHFSIGVIFTCAYATNIQLWRVAYPEEMNPPPVIGAFVHALLRAFAATPMTADSATMSNVWVAALLLNRDSHRKWLENQIKKRIVETDFFGWKFALHGILHGWALVDGTQEGRFKSMPEGATEVADGVSQNLWRADGIMNTALSDLSKEDEDPRSPEGQKPLYRFQGDSPLYSEEDDGEEVESDVDNTTTAPQTPDSGKRIPLDSLFIDDY